MVGQVAYKKGYIKEMGVKPIDVEEGRKLAGFEAESWGLNSRGSAERARKYLGWKPKCASLEDEIPHIIDEEAKLLGMKPGHAEVAAGGK